MSALSVACALGVAGSAQAATDAIPVPSGNGGTRPAAQTRTSNLLAAAKSWAYQLRGIEPEAIVRSPYDIVVIDFADREKPFTAEDIGRMRVKPDGSRRVVLAYLSIGEAERYRAYWQQDWYLKPPAWLGPENPEWKGNFPVRFWDSDWRRIIWGSADAYLDRIMAAGFDGAYLDRVDVHTNWETEKPDAEQQMIAFVSALSSYAKAARPEFLIVPQNAEELLENDAYLRAIDGVAKEDLLFGLGHGDKPNDAENVSNSVGLLQRARKAGKRVLVVEYLCDRRQIARTESRLSRDLGFLPLFAPRTLHTLGMAEQDYCLPPGAGGRRVAILLGSSSYQNAPHLSAPATDVRTMAEALRQVGFTDVRERMDLGRDSISQELQRFAEAARTAEWALIYYAGLGINVDETSYLVPINARIERPADVDRESIPIDELEAAVAPASKVRLMFFDACRPNAFLERMRARGMTQSVSPGIVARTSSRPIATAYSSSCDSTLAEPGNGGPDTYTAALARHLTTPGLELPWLMERVRDSVLRMTKGKQQPVHLGTLPDAATFVTGPAQGGR